MALVLKTSGSEGPYRFESCTLRFEKFNPYLMDNLEQPDFAEKEKKSSKEKGIESHIPYAEIQGIVQSLQLEDHEQFQLNDQIHQLIFCAKNEEGGAPIEFHKSTVLSGFDIYAWESIKTKGEDFLRAALVHELIEIIIPYLRPTQEGSRTVTLKQARKLDRIDHDIAVRFEKKYVSENFSPDRQKEYELFARELRRSH